MKRILPALFALLTLPAASQTAPSFLNEVHPILAEHCMKCHAGDRRKGGLSMSSRELLLQGGETGPAVAEGNHAQSLLYARITAANPDERMPPDGPALDPEKIEILKNWIDAGLPWENVNKQPPGYIAPLELQVQEVPQQGNLVDFYLRPYLALRGIAEPDAISDALFLRRATLDVTGLLPTREELERFLGDPDPDKREKKVDALLANNQAYAEHWMSFWNDLLRNDFTGTGYIDGGREPITDWLYQALLKNTPYDAFVRELIDPRPASRGFIKGIVWRGDNATVQLPSMQAASNVSQVFLGVNLKCASCHDSFVNHWKLKDAFGLANCFSDQPMEMVRCDTPTGEAAPYQFLWPQLGQVEPALTVRQKQERIAELVTLPENGPFTRTIVNRYWALLFGRGLVEPLDAIEGEPWHPRLLDALARHLIDNRYDLKQTLAVMMKSRAYSWRAVNMLPEAEAEQAFQFAGPEVRRMTAEQFYDALSLVTGVWHDNPNFLKPEERESKAPQGPVRAWRLVSDDLSRALGRTNREQVTSRRESASTTLQFLELMNGKTLAEQVKRSAKALSGGAPDTASLITSVYLAGLQRAPNPSELELAQALVGSPPQQEGTEDFLWSLIMLPEFQLLY